MIAEEQATATGTRSEQSRSSRGGFNRLTKEIVAVSAVMTVSFKFSRTVERLAAVTPRL
jgi:hypothetical protein